jgi:hypothetical protein
MTKFCFSGTLDLCFSQLGTSTNIFDTEGRNKIPDMKRERLTWSLEYHILQRQEKETVSSKGGGGGGRRKTDRKG